jgi:hypothetical protein
VVHLDQLTTTITRHAEVEFIIFRHSAVECTFFYHGDEKRDGILVIQLVDEITPWSMGKDDCLTVAKDERGHQNETYVVTVSGSMIAHKPGTVIDKCIWPPYHEQCGRAEKA